jgi:hypothetical protein
MDPDTKIHLKRATISLAKVLSSPVPVLGVSLGEFLEYRSQVKLERLWCFYEEFVVYVESEDSFEFDHNHLTSEEFGDIFESILWRVVNTASKEKAQRFKKILLNEMKHTYESDFKETFLDIVSRINEDQIQILNHFRNVKGSEPESDPDRGVIDGGAAEGESAEVSLNRERDLLGFDEAKYLFYVQDLVSKSLLYDEIVALFGGGTKPYTNLRITPFGEEFLGFIEGFPDQ